MDPHLLRELNAERRARRAVVMVTDLGNGRDRVVREGDDEPGELGEAISKIFKSGKSGVIEVDGRSFFLNAHLPPPRIVIIGAVHISQALAPMAQLAGFDVTIIDPRTAFASDERFHDVELIADWPEEVLEKRPLDRFTALVAVTHDPKIDDFPLLSALGNNCFYVGALGSKKTHGRRVERLTEQGADRASIDRIAAPIGLPIGASSPAEIAVAVLAQIIEALHRRELVRETAAVAAE